MSVSASVSAQSNPPDTERLNAMMQSAAAARFATAASSAVPNADCTLISPAEPRLTDPFVDPGMGSRPWIAPDLANPGSMVSALPLRTRR